MNLGNTAMDNFIEVVCVFGIIGGLIFGFQVDYKLYFISIVFILILIFSHIKKKQRLIRLRKEKLKNSWGKEHKEKRDFEHIRKLYDLLNNANNRAFVIDDTSWGDLNMDVVFSKIDHTKSFPGMQVLYNILRLPKFDYKVLKERNKIINLLLQRKDIAQKVQFPLSFLGKKQTKEILSYFQNGLDIETKNLIFYRILSYLS